MSPSSQAGKGSRALGVLVVEDEGMIAALLEDILDMLGHKVVVSTGELSEALAAAREGGFDCAILDLNLNGESSIPVADELQRQGIPFGFASGYNSLEDEGRYGDIPTLQKPYAADDVERLLAQIGPAA